jgi:hypothetical protein
MSCARDFENIRDRIFDAIKLDRNNLQETSIELIKELSKFIVNNDSNSEGKYKDQAESLIELLNKHIDLERDDWRRVRSAIEHENNLTNNRITWLISSQTFLFAAFVLAFNQWANAEKNKIHPEAHDLYPYLLVLIALSGIISSLLTYQALKHGSYQLHFLDNWWHEGKAIDKVINLKNKLLFDGLGKVIKSHPPLQGSLKFYEDKFLDTGLMPIYFCGIWLTTIIYIFIKSLSIYYFNCSCSDFWVALNAGYLSFLFFYFIGKWLKSYRKKKIKKDLEDYLLKQPKKENAQTIWGSGLDAHGNNY